ncbi:MAG: AAA family ATPase, partial [Planctomycetota bacterium]
VAYSSPETLQGRAVGPQSDLYALGIVLYEVATGRHPFSHCGTADEMIHAHLHEVPPRPSYWRPRIAPLLEQLLLELLQKDPNARPDEAADVARILQQGEASDWWQEHEQRAPALASGRRLQRMRRPAETPFQGRHEELAKLTRQLQYARGSKGRARCISGPQGIGRRRLLDEAMTQWLSRDTDLLYLGGEADPGLGHAEPFASSLLDYLLRGEGLDSPQAIARAEARSRLELDLDDVDAQALIAVATGQSTEEPEVRANRLANALLSLPRKGRVLVLRIDAADRLDTSGRLVLERLLRDLPRRHILLLVTAGPDWQLPTGIERLDLHGLDEAEFLEHGRALFAPGRAPIAQLEAAHATFSGSPGNLIEALEHLAQNDALFGRPGDFHGLPPEVELRPAPHHVQRFEQRVERMPPAHRRVLAAAAVLGTRCALSDLVALTGSKELLVLETLSLFRGRVVRAQGGEVVFRHRDFQQALLRRLEPQERTALHQRAALVFEQQKKPPLEIGMHRSQALDHEGCVEPLLLGLAEIVRAGSRRTSLRIAARLQVHVQHLPAGRVRDEAQLRILLLSARARRNAGQPQFAAQQFRAADSLARELGDPLGSGEALTGLAAATFDHGHLMQAILLLENAHRELENPESDRARVLAADAHGLHGRILLYLGESEDGLRHVQAALRLVPDTEIERHRHLQIDLARLEALRHHYPTALKTLSKVDDRQARHLPRVRMRLRLYRGQFRAALGDEDAAQDLRACIQEAERLSLWAYAARARIFLGERAFFDNRDDDARTELIAARELAQRGRDPLGHALASIHLMRLGEDDDTLQKAVDDLGLPSLQTAWLLASAYRHEQRGDIAMRDQCSERALALCNTADVPLALHLRALALEGLEASARALVRTIAGKFRDRRTQKRFTRTWENGARV